MDKLYFGFDFSTQQVKGIVINDALQIVYEDGIKFDSDLPEFRTQGGVHVHEDNLTVTAPTIMWVKALDALLMKMKQNNFDFSQVLGISGAGQQHGSVYWKTGSRKILNSLNPEQTLHEQLADAFSITDSPIWMDSSTTQECRNLEKVVGGAQQLADITGSRAYERFTGNQIAKICRMKPEAYADTERISLVSSFAGSIFLGDFASIDQSDGSGMNLMYLRQRKWNEKCLKECGSDLGVKLGDPVPSTSCLGRISPYFVDKFGFNPQCQVVAFTGDNPGSLAGMRIGEDDICVSLGSSDTLFLWLHDPRPALEGHIFVNPVQTEDYMALVCYKNGSLVRERVRDECAEGSWETFAELLKESSLGNDGNIGFYFDIQEITPHANGLHRFDSQNKKVTSFSTATEVRALIEGQFVSKLVHAERLGYVINENSRVLATGGASTNKAILQVMADVFNAPVYIQEVANSACLGCAYRAKHAVEGAHIPFSKVVEKAPAFVRAVTPNPDAREVYAEMKVRFKVLEEIVVNHSQNTTS